MARCASARSFAAPATTGSSPGVLARRPVPRTPGTDADRRRQPSSPSCSRRTGQRTGRPTTGPSAPVAPTFGPSVWPLLRERGGRARPRAGRALGHVRVDGPARAAPGAGRPRRRPAAAHLRSAYARGGVVRRRRLELLGDSGHGVALWPRRPAGRLGARAGAAGTPGGAETRRLVAAGHTLPVPEDDLDDLVADYLPRLRATCRWSPPTARWTAGARRAAAGPDGDLEGGRARCTSPGPGATGSATDDRVYGLDETRGLRGIRRPDAEQALLDALELDEEHVHRLCGGPGHASTVCCPSRRSPGRRSSPSVEGTLASRLGGRWRSRRSAAGPTSASCTEAPVIRFARSGRRRGRRRPGAHRLARPRGRHHDRRRRLGLASCSRR